MGWRDGGRHGGGWHLAVVGLAVVVIATPRPVEALGWASVPPAFANRSGYTQTVLLDGRVLVAGGEASAASATNQCWLFDPATGAWTSASPMNDARAYHTATLLKSGEVLVAGGVSGATAVTSLELYDPAQGTWTKAKAAFATGRAHHTATLLRDGDVLFAGGVTATGTVLGTARVYQPGTQTWLTTTGVMLNTKRFNHTATCLADGTVLLVGGDDGTGTVAGMELYDPQKHTFSPAGQADARQGQVAVYLGGQKVLIAGGYTDAASTTAATTYGLYDAGGWQVVGGVGRALGVPAGVRLPDGRVLLAGSSLGSKTVVLGLGASATSQAGPSLDGSASDPHATLLFGGRVLVTSPDVAGAPFGDLLEPDDPADGTHGLAAVTSPHWEAPVPLPDGSMALFGGATGNKALLDHIERYTPGATGWGTVSDTPWPSGAGSPPARRQVFGLPLLDGRVLLGGGTVLTTQLESTSHSWIWNPGAGMASGPDLGEPRSGRTQVLLPDGSALLVGGAEAKPVNQGSGPGQLLAVCTPDAVSCTESGPAENLEGVVATLLPDGTVLIAGGVVGASTDVLTTWIYTPGAGPSQLTKTLNHPHGFGTLTLLDSGQVLIAGGSSTADYSGANTTSELYDPSLEAWSDNAGHPMTAARFSAGAIRLEDGEVLVVGGQGLTGADLFTTEIFDPVDSTWRPGPGITYSRRQPALFHLPDGDVLILGGLAKTATADANLAPPEILSFGSLAGTTVTAATAASPGSSVTLTGTFTIDGRMDVVRVRLESRLGGPDAVVIPTAVSQTAVSFVVPAGTPDGPYYVHVEAPGRVGTGFPLEVRPATVGTVDGGSCQAATACASNHCVASVCCDQACGSGTCVTGTCVPAATDGGTPEGGTPDAGTPLANGQTCSADTDCASNHCVGTVCCTTSCLNGTCATGVCETFPDAGPGTADAGPGTADAGPGTADAGPGTADAGPGTADAGPGVTDGGTVTTDGGTGTADAGPGVADGGAATDAGTSGSGGGHAAADGGPKAAGPQLYGCLCGQGGSAPGWAVFLVAIVLLRLDRRRRVGFWVVLLGTALATGPARAQTPAPGPKAGPITKVAVLELQAGPGVDPKLAAVITQSLTAAIQARGPSVVSSQDIKAALGFEAQRQLLGCKDDSACLAQIGGALGVDHVVAGSLARIGESYVMNLQLLDIVDASVSRRFSRRVRGGTAEAFLDIVDPAARALFPGPGPSASAGGTTPEVASAPGHPVGITVGLRGQIDPLLAGRGAFTLYAGWRATDTLTVGLGALAARPFGAYLRVAWVLFAAGHRVHPLLAAEVPLLFSSPLAAGVSLSPGVEVGLTRWLDLVFEVPLSYELTAPAGANRFWLFLAGGVDLRL